MHARDQFREDALAIFSEAAGSRLTWGTGPDQLQRILDEAKAAAEVKPGAVSAPARADTVAEAHKSGWRCNSCGSYNLSFRDKCFRCSVLWTGDRGGSSWSRSTGYSDSRAGRRYGPG